MARWNNGQREVHAAFGAQLQKLRAKKDISYGRASEVTGLGPQTLFSLECGTLAPRLDHIADLYPLYGEDVIEAMIKVVRSK